MTVTDEQLTDQLRARAPRLSIDDAAELSRNLARETVQASRRQRGRWLAGRGRRIAAIAAVFVAVPGVALAGQQFVARTGIFGASGMSENDTSEWINVCAADFPRLVRSLPRPSEALPPGTTWDAVATEVVHQNVSGVGQGCHGKASMVQDSMLRADFTVVAQGHWTCAAVDAHAAGHPRAALQAAREVAATYDRLAAAGKWGDTNWKPLRDAAYRGDFGSLERDLRVNYPAGYCTSLTEAR